MWLINATAFDAGLAPRAVGGVSAALMLTDVSLRWLAGVAHDSLGLTLLVPKRFADIKVFTLFFINDQYFSRNVLVNKEAVLQRLRRLFATALL